MRILKQVKKEIGVKSFLEYDDNGNSSWHWRLHKDGDENKSLFDMKIPKFPKLPSMPKLPKIVY